MPPQTEMSTKIPAVVGIKPRGPLVRGHPQAQSESTLLPRGEPQGRLQQPAVMEVRKGEPRLPPLAEAEAAVVGNPGRQVHAARQAAEAVAGRAVDNPDDEGHVECAVMTTSSERILEDGNVI